MEVDTRATLVVTEVDARATLVVMEVDSRATLVVIARRDEVPTWQSSRLPGNVTMPAGLPRRFAPRNDKLGKTPRREGWGRKDTCATLVVMKVDAGAALVVMEVDACSTLVVIARRDEVPTWQSSRLPGNVTMPAGLPRRFAPRNDKLGKTPRRGKWGRKDARAALVVMEVDARATLVVIARRDEVPTWQSSRCPGDVTMPAGLPRRFAPRNDTEENFVFSVAL
jgi:hypothetical protein